MYLKHGIDLVNFHRIEFKDENLSKKILTKLELYEFSCLTTKDQKCFYLANRWAIKEAILKCLDEMMPLPQIEIKKRDGRYYWEHNEYKSSISTSNEDQYIIASCIVYK